MSLLKKLPRDLKIFLFMIVLRNVLKGIPVSKVRQDIKALQKSSDTNTFNNIHSKLVNSKNISAEELSFLVECERKRQWDKI